LKTAFYTGIGINQFSAFLTSYYYTTTTVWAWKFYCSFIRWNYSITSCTLRQL